MLNKADEPFLVGLRTKLPSAAFREATDHYLTERRGRFRGQGVVVAPESTEEVATVVQACAEARVPVIPFGGGTGLVGAQLADDITPVILTLERMNKIRKVLPSENVLVAEAGAILADVQAVADGAGRLFPLSLASEGSARIGGLLGTNAGGVNVLRYGNARALCLGLEVVTADGAIWHGLSRLRKDNTGYDLRDLLIGSEGTLGVITAASLRLFPRPAGIGTAWLSVPSPAVALDLLALAGERLGDNVSAFELIHREGVAFLLETGFDIVPPLDPMPEWSVLVEVGLPAGLPPGEALEGLFEAALEAGLSEDGVVAQSQAQRTALWDIREKIPEGNMRIGSIASHDISVPLSEIPAYIAEADRRLAELGRFRVNCFGHVGDGNLHYNVFPEKGRSKQDYASVRDAVTTCVHQLAHEVGGSVSAEHGIGRLKVDDLERYGDPQKLAMMRTIKAALDPAGILNPGAIFRK